MKDDTQRPHTRVVTPRRDDPREHTRDAIALREEEAAKGRRVRVIDLGADDRATRSDPVFDRARDGYHR